MKRGRGLAPAIAVDDAVAQAVATARTLPPLEAEEVDIGSASGRVLAETCVARWDVPGADVSMMDGWAVRAADLTPEGNPDGITLRTAERSAAGHPRDAPLPPRGATRIFTGAVLPAGADAVVPQEQARSDADTVVFDAEVAESTRPGTFVRTRGDEQREGETLLTPGEQLGAGAIALLASSGHARVLVHRRPRVAIVSTGDELVRLGQSPTRSGVVSSNGIMLAAMVEAAGGDAIVLPDAPDEPAQLQQALGQAARADVVVTSGGISVGDHDGVRPALEALGATVVWHGLALRPGKPAALFVLGDTLVFALPGNPASAFVCFELLVRPALLARRGRRDPRPRARRSVTLDAPIRGAGVRAHYVRGVWTGPQTVTPLRVQRSGNIASIASADVLLVVPPGVETVQAGESCEAIELEPPP